MESLAHTLCNFETAKLLKRLKNTNSNNDLNNSNINMNHSNNNPTNSNIDEVRACEEIERLSINDSITYGRGILQNNPTWHLFRVLYFLSLSSSTDRELKSLLSEVAESLNTGVDDQLPFCLIELKLMMGREVGDILPIKRGKKHFISPLLNGLGNPYTTTTTSILRLIKVSQGVLKGEDKAPLSYILRESNFGNDVVPADMYGRIIQPLLKAWACGLDSMIKGEISNAIHHLSEALRICVGAFWVWLLLSDCYRVRSRMALAINACDAADVLTPHHKAVESQRQRIMWFSRCE